MEEHWAGEIARSATDERVKLGEEKNKGHTKKNSRTGERKEPRNGPVKKSKEAPKYKTKAGDIAKPDWKEKIRNEKRGGEKTGELGNAGQYSVMGAEGPRQEAEATSGPS